MDKDSKSLSLARKLAWEMLTTIVPALLVALFVNMFVAEAVAVEEGPSMQPNLYVGYRVLTEKISYRFGTPQRGDVVVADRPAGETALIKRVVAVAGEVVEVRGGHTYVNGLPIDEPWVAYYGGPDYGPALVPDGHVFIVGDNRANSRDSRMIGPVPVDTIKRRAWLVYWPLDRIELLP